MPLPPTTRLYLERTTAEVGRFAICRTENKGRINKRLYVRLEA
jgi:Ser-tRNA(Ala) deacylase AlaX